MIHEEQLKPYCSEDLSLIENYELAMTLERKCQKLENCIGNFVVNLRTRYFNSIISSIIIFKE